MDCKIPTSRRGGWCTRNGVSRRDIADIATELLKEAKAEDAYKPDLFYEGADAALRKLLGPHLEFLGEVAIALGLTARQVFGIFVHLHDLCTTEINEWGDEAGVRRPPLPPVGSLIDWGWLARLVDEKPAIDAWQKFFEDSFDQWESARPDAFKGPNPPKGLRHE